MPHNRPSYARQRAIRQNWEFVYSLSAAAGALVLGLSVLALGYVGTYALNVADGLVPKSGDVSAFYGCMNFLVIAVPLSFVCLALCLFTNVKKA